MPRERKLMISATGRLLWLSFLCAAVGLSQVHAEATGPETVTSLPKSDLSREINITDLSFYVKTEPGRDLLKQDFHSISEGQRKPWNRASLPENINKNRYKSLLAYDETRVVLETLPDDPYSDYINANYIDGYNRPREYVATQGPLPNTVNDFWRMVWQLETHKIIMLANVIEHGEIKVEKYWPETNATFGDIVVKKLSEYSRDEHVVRTFTIRKLKDFHTRVLRQFHFTGWPDFGVPTDRISLLSLIQQARKYRLDDTAPLLVHCSAGVGRTGTVILMDSMIQMAQAENKVDYPKRLNHMRDQRVDVVEKEGQYIFAHEALNDLLFDPDTESQLQEVQNFYNEIDTPSYLLGEDAFDLYSEVLGSGEVGE